MFPPPNSLSCPSISNLPPHVHRQSPLLILTLMDVLQAFCPQHTPNRVRPDLLLLLLGSASQLLTLSPYGHSSGCSGLLSYLTRCLSPLFPNSSLLPPPHSGRHQHLLIPLMCPSVPALVQALRIFCFSLG